MTRPNAKKGNKMEKKRQIHKMKNEKKSNDDSSRWNRKMNSKKNDDGKE